LEAITGDRPLSIARKSIFAWGDHTVGLALSAVSLLYLPFLMEFGGLSPLLAGLVIWVARVVDAFTDPAMGRISDMTRWRSGRRRPYFLIGALPFGVCFALMWVSDPADSELARFAYYSAVYIGVSLATTCVSVPYLALLPEMATDYDERTSLNTFRSAAAVAGTFVAVAMKPIAEALGGDAAGWLQTAGWMGVWVALPWVAVFAVSFERPGFRREANLGIVEGALAVARHRSFRNLASFYILARIAVDLIGAMFLLYFTYWIGREADFAPVLGMFLAVVVISLPGWLAVARNRDKRTIFIIGAGWWAAIQIVIFLAGPDWPRPLLFVVPAIAAIGYAVADLMPWAMLGEVIDEDELATGERREGLYVGSFMFLRKLGGASAVLAVGAVLQFSGFDGSGERQNQSDEALLAIRLLTSLVPMALLIASIWVASRFPLTREAHRAILDQLEARNAARHE
jgi:GPH family glycoside/pentoside/hexuronide:cation symporter